MYKKNLKTSQKPFYILEFTGASSNLLHGFVQAHFSGNILFLLKHFSTNHNFM